jgi:hypothetical protein
MLRLSADIFSSLREMDSECPTGLCDYGQYAGLGSLQVELGCHRGLRSKLRQRGFQVDEAEWCYPGSRERCDLRVVIPEATRALIEVKNIWSQWYYGRIKTSNPKLIDLHHDVVNKLSRITKDDADVVAELIIGFDGQQRKLDPYVEGERKVAAGLGWVTRGSDSWPDRQCSDCRINGWFWWKCV